MKIQYAKPLHYMGDWLNGYCWKEVTKFVPMKGGTYELRLISERVLASEDQVVAPRAPASSAR